MISLDTGLWQRGPSSSFSPLSLSPALWLDASDASTLFQSNGGAAAAADGDPVGYWLDKSGNGRHLTQTSGVNKPLLKLAVKNGKNGVLFDGASSFFDTAGYSAPVNLTHFRVIKRTTVAITNLGWSHTTYNDYPQVWFGDNYIYARHGGFSFQTTLTNTSTGWFIVRTGHTGTGSFFVAVNNVNKPGSVSGSAAGPYAWTLYGKNSAMFAKDYVHEDLVFPSALSAIDIGSVEFYLNTKWGVY